MNKFIVFVMTMALTISTAKAEEFSVYQSFKEFTNSQGDLVVIDTYQRLNPSPYAVIDKKTKTLYVYDQNGERLATENVHTYAGDELQYGGSGIYKFVGIKDNVYYGRAEKDGSIHGLFKGQGPLQKDMLMYVVPETTAHRFRIRNSKITFNAEDVLRPAGQYNYSPRNLEYRRSTFRTDRTDSFSTRYVQALQDEKQRLMQIYGLENDEYNMLAEFAYGVLSPETNYGRNWKYRLKEFAPYVTSVLKGNGFDTEENSRGPTQMKNVPDLIEKYYGIKKEELHNPDKAAIATLGFSADALIEIRNRARQHPGICEETLQNYMYYIYQGKTGLIKNKSATPNFNVKNKMIQEAIKELHIEE